MSTPSGQPPAPKPPIPGFVWVTLGVLTVAAIVCFTVALLLAPHWPPKSNGQGLEGWVEANTERTERLPQRRPLAPAPVAEPNLSSTLPPEVTAQPSPITEYEVVNSTAQAASLSTPRQTPASPTTPATANISQPVKKPGHLALVIDDMGLAPEASQFAVDHLPSPVTFAFLTYAPASKKQAQQAKQEGHQIIVHIPMEPLPHGELKLDPGPNTLHVGDTTEALQHKLAANLDTFKNLAIGANNHMGSRFTADDAGMQTVLTDLQQRGLFFLDSRTIARTATRQAVQQTGFTQPVYTRDVFLDDTPTEAEVEHQLANAVRIAQKNGHAIAIGHPHPATLAVLLRELPTLTSRTGVVLVPLQQ